MWDFGQYNLVVKQVEGCADILKNAAGNADSVSIHSRVSRRLVTHLEAAAKELDKRALRMLALYDPAAAQMLRDGITYDPLLTWALTNSHRNGLHHTSQTRETSTGDGPRRDMFRNPPSANALKQKAITAPVKSAKTKSTRRAS